VQVRRGGGSPLGWLLRAGGRLQDEDEQQRAARWIECCGWLLCAGGRLQDEDE
ncbi:unnamed protein product, partial [Ectocarpus sp. 8 AP-2014]